MLLIPLRDHLKTRWRLMVAVVTMIELPLYCVAVKEEREGRGKMWRLIMVVTVLWWEGCRKEKLLTKIS